MMFTLELVDGPLAFYAQILGAEVPPSHYVSGTSGTTTF